MTSVVINTACLADGERRSSQGLTMDMRAYAMRNFIVPAYLQPGIELIIVGEYEEGDGYTYVPCPSVYGNCRDALIQRHAGFQSATQNTIVFQHDDHLLAGPLPALPDGIDVLIPHRYTRLRGPLERLNNGEKGNYISGHMAMYKREVIEACPWSEVMKTHIWDIAHTQQILKAGFTAARSSSFIALDVEYGSTPWA